MRNSSLLAASLVSGFLLLAAACSNVGTFGDSFAERNTPNAAGDNAPGGSVSSDGGTPSLAASAVSQLCSESQACLPDDDGTSTSSGGYGGYGACATRVVDGGTDNPRHDNGCRVVAGAPTCFRDGGADRQGVDGVSCSSGSDCAPGFECVVGDTSRGAVCRRYCCAGSSACNDHTAQNGGRTFCDVQQLEQSDALVPVCMPIKQCSLLKKGECSASETCAVVSDRGETGCVAIGPQEAGASCERAHCQAGLTCLGTPGARRCYTLCRLSDESACNGTKKCTTSSLFPDSSSGVCQ